MKPGNMQGDVNAMLTDFYQLSMVSTDWFMGRHNDRAVFDLFFRNCPFGGEFAIFAGLEQALRYVETFGYTDEQIAYLKNLMPDVHPDFFRYLAKVGCCDVDIYAQREGDIAFPTVPLMRIEGTVGQVQLLETTLLNIINFNTLCTTNAARYRLAAGDDKMMLEFGLRRAQGPDGGMTASRSAYIGGFDATSNVQAGFRADIDVQGTHAHSYVQSFRGLKDLERCNGAWRSDGKWLTFIESVLAYRTHLGFKHTNEGELAAFISYAIANPNKFLALVDTYDTLRSGVPNYICVARALADIGYIARGIRIDSGDLAYFSTEARQMLNAANLQTSKIAVSNDINEDILYQLRGCPIDIFGVGTKLVTCSSQSALGGVYKLVEFNGEPCIKRSSDEVKITTPGRKDAWHLMDENGKFDTTVMTLIGEDVPMAGKPFLCRHPFIHLRHKEVVPTQVIPVLQHVWNGNRLLESQSLHEIRSHRAKQIGMLREDEKRRLNPHRHHVSLSQPLFDLRSDLLERNRVHD